MSAIGRLWRRAPAWRFCLITAAIFTALAAMFPPIMPHLRWPGGLPGTGADPMHAHFNPQPTPAPSHETVVDLPPPGPGRQGIIPFGGRLLPLPTGSWQELAIARQGGAEQPQVVLLDRVEGGRLSGLVLVAGPAAMSGAVGSVGLPSVCNDPGRLAGHVVPLLPGQGPLTHECWSTLPVDMQNLTSDANQGLLQSGLRRLGEFGVQVSAHMLAANFVRSDETGWRLTTIMVPDRHDAARLADWATRFAPIMHKGFDHTLVPADLTAAVTRDPG